MTGSEYAQIITAAATLAGVLGGVAVSIVNGRRIKGVHEATNGMKTELVAATRKLSRAQGKAAALKEISPGIPPGLEIREPQQPTNQPS